MPKHIAFLLKHAAIGALIACAFGAAILVFNLFGIGDLVRNTAEGPLAFGIFVVLCAITFGSVQMGIQIMAMGDDDDQGRGKRQRVIRAEPQALPLAVPVEDRPRAP